MNDLDAQYEVDTTDPELVELHRASGALEDAFQKAHGDEAEQERIRAWIGRIDRAIRAARTRALAARGA